MFPCRVSRHNALRCITSCYSFRYNKQLIAQFGGRHEDLSHPENSCLPRATWIFWVGQIFVSPSKLGNKCINIHPYVTEQFDNTQSASQTKRFCNFVIYAQFIVPKLQSLLRHVILLHGMYRHYIAEISLNVTLNHNHHHLTRDVDFSYLQNLHTVSRSKSPHVNGVLNIYAELHERSE